MNELSPIDAVKGIGKNKKVFERAGINRVGDLLHYYPKTYDTFAPPVPISEVQEDALVCVCGIIDRPVTVRYVKTDADRGHCASG